MQEQSQATGTWRIGFDLAAFVLLATVAGMAAAVTLASIALFLGSVVPSAPVAAPISIPGAPPAPAAAPAAISPAPASNPALPAGAPGADDSLPAGPTVVPAAPAAVPPAPEAPAGTPTVLTQLARTRAPAL